jgi:zinc protease
MNTMLGGLFSSRINMNLREEHGYTYGAFSFFGTTAGWAIHDRSAGADGCDWRRLPSSYSRSWTAFTAKPLTDAELRLSKDSIIRSLAGNFESASIA